MGTHLTDRQASLRHDWEWRGQAISRSGYESRRSGARSRARSSRRRNISGRAARADSRRSTRKAKKTLRSTDSWTTIPRWLPFRYVNFSSPSNIACDYLKLLYLGHALNGILEKIAHSQTVSF